MAINFSEGNETTETFTITDQQRLNRTISVSKPSAYVTAPPPITIVPIPPRDNNSDLEIPVPIHMGGTNAITATSALFNLGIDVTNRVDGSILAYKTTSGNFEATNEPIKLSIDGGFF